MVWIFSFLLALVTVFKIIPNDEFVVHSMGMTLSRCFDHLHLYQLLIFSSLLFLWVIYVMSYKAVRENHQSSLVKNDRPKSKKTDPKFQMLKIEMKMILSISICYVPLIIVQSFREFEFLQLKDYGKFSKEGNSVWNFCLYLSSRLVVLNSFLNCIIYNYNNKYVWRELHFFKKRNTNQAVASNVQKQEKHTTKICEPHKSSTHV